MLDILVLGSGVAGLSAAIRAARAGCSVAVLTKSELASSATQYAQGGVAAALEADVDSPQLHLSDTVSAGAGLCDLDAVEVLVREGPARVRDLIGMGAEFDRSAGASELAYTREGGHSVPRIIHAGGDATGAEIERALVHAVRETAADVHERWFALDLLVEAGRVGGVRALDPDGAEREVHPTALDHPSMPRPLLSEALRGEGAVLRDENGVAFMAEEHPRADLAPRDVVARAIARRCNERNLPHLWLDARGIHDFEHRFPTIWRVCRSVGLDPTRDLLPVAPAAHYLCGGICTDLDGAATLPSLWACGEVACSGVHGANRLASNSLLDGLVFGSRCVDAIVAGKDRPDATGVLRGFELAGGPERSLNPASQASPSLAPLGGPGATDRAALQRVMTRDAGVLRDASSLRRAREALAVMEPVDREVANLLSVSRALVGAALVREESRGTHTRLDFPESSSEFLGRFVFTDHESPQFVPLRERAAAR